MLLALPKRMVLAFLFVGLLLSVLPLRFAQAANLAPRSIRIGSTLASEVTAHEMRFSTTTNASIGSLVFEYCASSPIYGAPCTAPAGLIVNGASIGTQSGITGLSISGANSTANKLVLTRAASVIGSTQVVIRMDNITNQSTANQSVFVRLSTHSSADGTGSPVDYGAVVYSTADGVGVGGYVPPYLTFCVGVTVAPNCTSTEGALMGLGELTPAGPRTATSQFAGATNDPTGYNTYVSGGTMTAGNEVIPALAANAGSIAGTSQFGINLTSNSNPIAGASVSGNGSAAPATGYGSSNSFRYNSGERIAFTSLPTDYNRFTVTYMVNVSENQRPGIYASSFTYTAIASF